MAHELEKVISMTTKNSIKTNSRNRASTQQLMLDNLNKSSALDHALRAAKLGIRVIWIPHRTKAPIVRDWPDVATTDHETIRRWGTEHSGCNFGLVMGNGFVALDIDGRDGLAALASKGLDLPPTHTQFTPGGGLHFIYRVPKDADISNSASRFFGKVDVRGKSGQVVCAGSIHPNGGTYEIADPAPIAALPEDWLLLLTETCVTKTRRSQSANDIPEGKRNDTIFRELCSLRSQGASAEEMRIAAHARNDEISTPLAQKEIESIIRSALGYNVPQGVQDILNSDLPKVVLTGDNRLLSHLACDLGRELRAHLYQHSGEVVMVDGRSIHVLAVQEFRTYAERYVICTRMKKGGLLQVGTSMNESEARGVLASHQFKDCLRPLKKVSTCRLPVIRANGRLELLSEGYDSESQIFTHSEVEYREDLSIVDALSILDDLFGEFRFRDGGRSKAVAVAALIGLYAFHLLSEGALRPAFTITKNAEGAGAGTLAACVIVPALGYLPIGTMPDEDGEMRKLLLACVREAQPVLMLDNVKGRVGLPSLEGFLTATVYSGRILGSNETLEAPNLTTVFITANGATLSPDMRRRTLFIELHLEVERAEDRVFKRPLDEAVLKKMRPDVLAACWSLVRHWDAKGRPSPSRSHSAFPEWARIIGGIAECAGFECPLATANVSVDADEDGADMQTLVAAMARSKGRVFKGEDLIRICREQGVFVGLVGLGVAAEMTKAQNSAFGYMLKRYDNRAVGGHKFIIDGKSHQRRFRVESWGGGEHGDMVEHGGTPQASKKRKIYLKGEKPCQTMPPCHPTTSNPPGKVPKYARRTRARGMYSKILVE
jgi:putative DNA primase/helicase